MMMSAHVNSFQGMRKFTVELYGPGDNSNGLVRAEKEVLLVACLA